MNHSTASLIAVTTLLAAAGCSREGQPTAADAVQSAPADAAVTSAGARVEAAPPAEVLPVADKPLLGARAFATLVYAKPNRKAKRLGYLRVGAKVPRSAEPVGTRGCKAGWYKIEPEGYVCAGKDATTELDDPLLRAAARRPRLDKPLPYPYGFVRATLPLYLRVPTARQQFKREFKLKDHLQWYKEHRHEVQSVTLGARDLPVDALGRVLPGKQPGDLGRSKASTEMSLGELFGGNSDDDPWPFWLRDGERLIPNISGFDVPEYALFADRARRKTGLAFVGSFTTDEHHLNRRFAITTDLRLAPTTKVKPDTASPWHGIELGGEYNLPLALVRRRGARAYQLGPDGTDGNGTPLEKRTVHKLTGRVKKLDGDRYVQLADGRWVSSKYVGIAVTPRKWPRIARKGGKWIEVDLSEQTLVLWEGKKPIFMTLVSTGRVNGLNAIGDPKKTTATPRGIFKIYAKHITTTMDSDEGSGRRLNRELGLKPGDKGYVPQRGDGIYGVTARRGAGLYKLRDVPHVQYFHKNYALHGAYWHDVFGIPRSHGCINLAPADSLRLLQWTGPSIPPGWHGIRTEQGTTIIIHK